MPSWCGTQEVTGTWSAEAAGEPGPAMLNCGSVTGRLHAAATSFSHRRAVTHTAEVARSDQWVSAGTWEAPSDRTGSGPLSPGSLLGTGARDPGASPILGWDILRPVPVGNQHCGPCPGCPLSQRPVPGSCPGGHYRHLSSMCQEMPIWGRAGGRGRSGIRSRLASFVLALGPEPLI